MEYNIQKADLMRRLPAWLLDTILLIVLITGFAALWSLAFDISAPNAEYKQIQSQYEQQYKAEYEAANGEIPSFETEEEWNNLTEDEQNKVNEAAQAISAKVEEALSKNERIPVLVAEIFSSFLTTISLSVLCAYTILEFIVPLLLKNGQTLGKKCFGIALMRKDGIKVTTFMVFARSILGKCTVETMLPICLIGAAMLFGASLWLVVAVALMAATVILTIATKQRTAIHDLMACTVAVDMGSQMIFDSVEEMEAHNAEIRENVASWEA